MTGWVKFQYGLLTKLHPLTKLQNFIRASQPINPNIFRYAKFLNLTVCEILYRFQWTLHSDQITRVSCGVWRNYVTVRAIKIHEFIKKEEETNHFLPHSLVIRLPLLSDRVYGIRDENNIDKLADEDHQRSHQSGSLKIFLQLHSCSCSTIQWRYHHV